MRVLTTTTSPALIIATFALFFLLMAPMVVHASDDQTPNTQILSSNTSDDAGSWERFSVTTDNSPFYVSSTTNTYTLQMNAYINGCTHGGSGCEWWIQAVVGIDNGSLISKANGMYVHDADLELWNGNNGPGFCDISSYIPEYVNIDTSDYNTLVQLTNNTSDLIYHLSVTDESNSTTFYSISVYCAMPYYAVNGVDFITQTEGVIVGCCGDRASFTPLSTTIFDPAYIDLTSNYNHLSSSSEGTQTGEASNLYQDPYDSYGTTYGSLYLYTVESTEYTSTDS